MTAAVNSKYHVSHPATAAGDTAVQKVDTYLHYLVSTPFLGNNDISLENIK